MVPRYSRPQMEAIWAPANRYRIWFEIEDLAAQEMGRIGTIPAEAARIIREKGALRAASAGMVPMRPISSAARASISNQMR